MLTVGFLAFKQRRHENFVKLKRELLNRGGRRVLYKSRVVFLFAWGSGEVLNLASCNLLQ
jgi:hypothetical protein